MSGALGCTASRAAWKLRLTFALSLTTVYLSLFAICYAWCGAAFYREALLHHITRADARHNFSPYFYALYLAPKGTLLRGLLSSLAFVPQAALLLALAARFGRDLPFCMFAQTLVFVSFNKVCTAQYFVWYHGLLPLVLPSTAALLRQQRPRTLIAAAVWTASLLLWLGVAHQLEFRARNTFLPLWLAGLLFFFANVYMVHETIRLHHSTPLFRCGRLARQACLYGAEATGEEATAAGLLLEGGAASASRAVTTTRATPDAVIPLRRPMRSVQLCAAPARWAAVTPDRRPDVCGVVWMTVLDTAGPSA